MSLSFPEKNSFDYLIALISEYEGVFPEKDFKVLMKLAYINYDIKKLLGLEEFCDCLIKEKLRLLIEYTRRVQENSRQQTVRKNLEDYKE